MKITITADGRNLSATTNGQPLTSGSVGIEAAFILSADYDDLAVTAVFSAGETRVDVLLTKPCCVVPWEVLQEPKATLFVGVVGKNGSGEIVIPTVWGRVGMIECGTVADGLDPEDPTPDIAAQILEQTREALAEAAETKEAAAQSAETAGNEADRAEAAREAIEDLGVTAHEDPDGPSVEKTVDPDTGAVTLDFGFKPAGVTEVNGQTGAVSLDLDDIPDGAQYVRPTPAQVQQIGTNKDDIADIEDLIPNQATPQNKLADKDFVNSSINSSAAFFRGAFPTRAALFAVAWQTSDPTGANYVSNNDYAYVADDETHNDEAWRYLYVLQPGGTGNGWQPQFRVNESPLTAAQLAALNSGATAETIASIADKYVLPAGGMPSADMSDAVRASLQKADSALQVVPDTYRTAAAQDEIDQAQDTEIRDLKSAVDELQDVLATGTKRIAGAYVTAEGVISSNASYDLVCCRVDGVIGKLQSASALVYAFYTLEPIMGSTSYNNSRTVLSTDGATYNVTVPDGVKWIAVRVARNADITISPKSELDNIRDDINILNTSDTEYTFKIGNYSYAFGRIPTYVSTNVNRFCIDGFILIKKGETISTKWSDVTFIMYICNSDGICVRTDSTYKNTFTATEDTYSYIVCKSDSISDFSVNSQLSANSYYFHKFRSSDSIWNGKTWYSFGTSMSDINTDGTTGNNGSNGRWPLIIDELSGMIRTNQAIGGGGIVPSASHGGNVKTNILACPYDVDLVTFECGLNDWGAITLGSLGDKSNDTFIGNFTQCIEYLTYNTRAKIVFVSMVPLTFTNYEAGTRRDVFFENSYGYTYRDYVNAMIEVCQNYGVEIIDASANALSNGRLNKDTIKDTTHFNWLGGMIYGRYIWSKLKDVLPLPKFPNNL